MTTVVAWLAFGVSAVSFMWQILTWMRSGARVIVRSAMALRATQSEQVNGNVEADEDRVTIVESSREIVITAVNIGRQATIVHEVGFRNPTRNGRHQSNLPPLNYRNSKPNRENLPARLEPGDEYVQYFDLDPLKQVFSDIPLNQIVPVVRVGRRWIEGKFSRAWHVPGIA